MMVGSKGFGAAACLVLQGCAVAPLAVDVQARPPVVTEVFSWWSNVGGHRLEYDVMSDQLAEEPDWKGPGYGPPPLDLDTAVALSRKDIPLYLPSAQNSRVRSAELHSLCCPERWFYTIDWLPNGADKGETLSIPVLLSGKTVRLRQKAVPEGGG